MLSGIDISMDDVILQSDSTFRPIIREPEGVTWIGDLGYFVTTDKGVFLGGSWTLFNSTGTVISSRGVDSVAAEVGHYPE